MLLQWAASKRSPCGHRLSPTEKVLLCLYTGTWQHLLASLSQKRLNNAQYCLIWGVVGNNTEELGKKYNNSKVILCSISASSDISGYTLRALCPGTCTPMGSIPPFPAIKGTERIILGWRKKVLPIVTRLISSAIYWGGLFSIFLLLFPSESPDPKLEVQKSYQWGTTQPFVEGATVRWDQTQPDTVHIFSETTQL